MILSEETLEVSENRSIMLAAHDNDGFTLTVEDEYAVAITGINREQLQRLLEVGKKMLELGADNG